MLLVESTLSGEADSSPASPRLQFAWRLCVFDWAAIGCTSDRCITGPVGDEVEVVIEECGSDEPDVVEGVGRTSPDTTNELMDAIPPRTAELEEGTVEGMNSAPPAFPIAGVDILAFEKETEAVPLEDMDVFCVCVGSVFVFRRMLLLSVETSPGILE